MPTYHRQLEIGIHAPGVGHRRHDLYRAVKVVAGEIAVVRHAGVLRLYVDPCPVRPVGAAEDLRLAWKPRAQGVDTLLIATKLKGKEKKKEEEG